MKKTTIAGGVVMVAAAVAAALLWQNGNTSADDVASQNVLTSQPPGAADAAAVARGRYVAIASDCTACHTMPDSKLHLAGGYSISTPFGGIYASNITPDVETGIGSWSNDQIVQYLKLGSNHVAVASGPMAEAVTNSTQHLTDKDLQAIAVYLKSVPASASQRPQPLSADNAQMKMGENVYSANCTACHNSDGKGIPHLAASLAGNPGLMAEDAASIVTTVLQGGRVAVTAGNPTSGAMPSFAWKLSDAQVAAVATYLRNNWGNAAPAVTTDDVAKQRTLLKLPAQMAEH